MDEFFDAFNALAQTKSVWIYVIIFFGKMLEVSASTLRIVLINRGIRMLGCLIAIIELTLWLMITSTVMASFQSDPLKVLVYVVAFALGIYLGSWLDEKLAFGLSSVQIVVADAADAGKLSKTLREQGFGITTIDVHGMDEKQHYMMFTMIKRKSLQDALKIINDEVNNAVITVSDVKTQKGGYLRNAPARHSPRRKGLPLSKQAVATLEELATNEVVQECIKEMEKSE